MKKKADPNSKPPQATPEGPQLSPDLHAVAGVVVADDMFLGVIVLAHDGELLHVKPGPLEFLDAGFCLGVRAVDPDDCGIVSHGLPSDP